MNASSFFEGVDVVTHITFDKRIIFLFAICVASYRIFDGRGHV